MGLVFTFRSVATGQEITQDIGPDDDFEAQFKAFQERAASEFGLTEGDIKKARAVVELECSDEAEGEKFAAWIVEAFAKTEAPERYSLQRTVEDGRDVLRITRNPPVPQ